VKFNLKDPFVDSKSYDAGETYIYLSKRFYDVVDSEGIKQFGEKPRWNNTRTIAWF
jgi:hypothetical protein